MSLRIDGAGAGVVAGAGARARLLLAMCNRPPSSVPLAGTLLLLLFILFVITIIIPRLFQFQSLSLHLLRFIYTNLYFSPLLF